MPPDTPPPPDEEAEETSDSSGLVQHEAAEGVVEPIFAYYEGQRLFRPKEENPIAEAHTFFGLAITEFNKVKAFDEAGEMDTHPRFNSLHATYAYLRQAYIIFNEESSNNLGVNYTITRLYKEVTDYDLRMSNMEDGKRAEYIEGIDMEKEAEEHLTEQSVMAIYDALISTTMSVHGFDVSRFEYTLGMFVQRYFPRITDLKIVDEDGEYKLDVKSEKPLTKSELKVLGDLQEYMSLIGQIGAIHNKSLRDNDGEMDIETQLELLEYVSQLTDKLHSVHETTNSHKARMQKFWTTFVKDPKLAYAPLLHDDGKVGVNAKILGKPARVCRTEIDQIRHHPVGTAVLLRNLLGIKNFAKFITLCSSHHINYALKQDSYPDYLPGERITESPKMLIKILKNLTIEEKEVLEKLELDGKDVVLFRLFALFDILEALTGKREYRSPEAKAEVVRRIRSKAGSLFDPNVASFIFKKLKEGGFDEELLIAENDDSETVSDPVFHYGQDILSFLRENKSTLEKEYNINLDGDIARLSNGLNFPTLKLSTELIRSNIYSLFQIRDGVSKLKPASDAQVDEVLMMFLAWEMDHNKKPLPADIESVESAIASINSEVVSIAS